ncbi:uncharacterized protein PSFLO_07321 [Pseudozyma flocculosa]|uniref:G domain-containing protein n=2 Tax=Pseudozyma flocculosa TaxID=84751 RepID=A0A5C3FEP0_9BASI|nr:uncharacterized protein PSFLO_07321 [Pseudozyma flocculosa]
MVSTLKRRSSNDAWSDNSSLTSFETPPSATLPPLAKRSKPHASEPLDGAERRGELDEQPLASAPRFDQPASMGKIECDSGYPCAEIKAGHASATRISEPGLRLSSSVAGLEGIYETSENILAQLSRLPEGMAGLAALKDSARRLAEGTVDRPTTFVVRGPTGAGKSTLINAIIGEDIMPTLSNQACTTAPTVILYNSTSDSYRAEVQFVSAAAWTDELQAFCIARRQEAGVPAEEDPPESLGSREEVAPLGPEQEAASVLPETGDARFSLDSTLAKLQALFPNEAWDDFSDGRPWTPAEILELDGSFRERLGSTDIIEAACASDMGDRLGEFDDPRRCNLWPLIFEIRVYIPCSTLRHGAALVDLPGTGDCNAARNEAAARYVREYDYMWVCLDICRATAAKELETIFSELSDEQLQSGRGKVSFLLTKTERGCGVLDKESVKTIHEDVPLLTDNEEFSDRHRDYHALVRATRTFRAQVQASSSAKTSSSDPDDWRRNAQQLQALKAECADRRRELARMYCQARSQAVGAALKERYDRLTSRLVHRSSTTGSLAELVYSTATEDFQALCRGDDGQAAATEEDTGVPELRRLIQRAAEAARTAAKDRQLQLAALLCKDACMLLGPALIRCESDRIAFDHRWGSDRRAGAPSVSETLRARFENFLIRAFNQLELDLVALGKRSVNMALNGSELKRQILPRWLAICQQKHWRVVRTAVIKAGVNPYGRLDINAELSVELVKLFESAWDGVISNCISSLRTSILGILNRFVDEFVANGLTERSCRELAEFMAQGQDVLERTLDDIIATFEMQGRQARIEEMTAAIAPKLAKKLKQTYQKGAEHVGKGSAKRRIDTIAAEIRKQDTFLDCALADSDLPFVIEAMHLQIRRPVFGLGLMMQERLDSFWGVSREAKGLEGPRKEVLEAIIGLAGQLFALRAKPESTLEARSDPRSNAGC